MLENLLEIMNLVDFEEYGFLQLTEVKFDDQGLKLSLHLSSDECPEAHPYWEVVASGVKEHALTLGYHDGVLYLEEHVLLLPHLAPQTSTSFRGKVEDPLAVAGALWERHRELAGDWIPFQRFLNSNISLIELIAGGFGMLADGPEPFILAYEDVMRQHGFSTSHLEPYKPVYRGGNEEPGSTPVVSLLLLDDSYIIAEQFEATAV